MISKERLNEALQNACRFEDIDNANKALSMGAEVNSTDYAGRTAFSLGAAYGRKKSCELLIKHGADINKQDFHGNSPLHLASMNGMEHILPLLISNVANINEKNDNGKTSVHLACQYKKFNILNTLILSGACINKKDKNNKPPLYYSLFNNDADSCLLLIAYGSNKNFKEDVSESFNHMKLLTMHEACAMGGFTSRMVELLRDHSSSLIRDEPKLLINHAKLSLHNDTAAAIQSFAASQAIEFMLKSASLGTSFPRA